MDRTVNNKFQTSPAIMADGRSFTDYRPACYVDTMIANANRIQGSNNYREFLINNGLNMMKTTDMYIEEKMANRACNNQARPASNFQKSCTITQSGMTCLEPNPAGLGLQLSVAEKSGQNPEGFDRTASSWGSL